MMSQVQFGCDTAEGSRGCDAYFAFARYRDENVVEVGVADIAANRTLAQDRLYLKQGEATVTMRIFQDHMMAEALRGWGEYRKTRCKIECNPRQIKSSF